MRQAAITAGFVDEDGGRRVKFVTEAEVRSLTVSIKAGSWYFQAAVLYAADSGSVEDWLVV
jgi:hypothetical protein